MRRARCSAVRSRSRHRSWRASDPMSRRSRRSSASDEAAPRPRRSPTSSATGSSSCAPTGSNRRRTSCAGSAPSTACSKRDRARRGRVVFVAMVYPSRQGLAEYLAYANEVRAGRRARQRPLGDARLDPDRARRSRRLRPVRRRPAALRRAARQPDPRRTQPRREGRPVLQPPRRRGVPVARSGRVRRDAQRRDRACIPTTSSRPRAPSTPRSSMPLEGAGARRRTGPGARPSRGHPPTG